MKRIFLLTLLFMLGFKYSYTQTNSRGRQVLINPDKSYYLLLNGHIDGEGADNAGPTVISKRRPDGSLDVSYGLNGYSKPIPVNDPHAALQADGKIVIAGPSLNFNLPGITGGIVRLKTSGDIDSSFGVNGLKAIGISPTSVAVQNDGKIVVAGGDFYKGFRVARYTTIGNLDNTFNGNGRVLIPFDYPSGPGNSTISHSGFVNAIALQHDGKIVLGGFAIVNLMSSVIRSFAIARCNINGSLDSTFDGDGKQTTRISSGDTSDIGFSLAIQKDEKIILAGYAGDHCALVRYNNDGSPDASFNSNVKQTVIPGHIIGVGVQSDGKIIIGGAFGFTVARFNTDGLPDNSFGNNGMAHAEFGPGEFNDDRATSLIVQSDDKIVVAGTSNVYSINGLTYHFSVARYNNNGSLDNTFDHDGKLTGDSTEVPTPPMISLTTPVNNTTYLSGGNVYLNAIATDADGTVSKVEFYNGSTLLFTATDTPYTFKWERVHTGNYTLTAKATDNSGLFTISDSVHISVVPNTPPTVSIINPANGETFLKGATIHLQAAASDADGRVGRVEFYNDTTLLTTEHKAPYTFDWRIIKAGNYTITAKATDNWGAVTTSAPINISVVPNQPPTVSIVSPSNGQTFTTAATINLEAAAQDADGRIVQVSFYNGATLLTNSEHKAPYTYQWQNVPAGTYTITAVAKDNWSAETTTAPITVTVASPRASLVNGGPSSANVITSINKEVTLSLAPNPATNILHINTTGLQNNKQGTITVISASGVVMKTLHTTGSSPNTQLNVLSLASGIYIIKIKNGDEVIYRQFVKI